MKEEIGIVAGKIWSTLREKKLTQTQLKKASGLNDKMLFLGLGWLAKEGKVEFLKENNFEKISLTDEEKKLFKNQE